jgi:predicted MFS family arabinose efflux permease
VNAALRRPGFGRLLAALAVSGVGDWLYNVALLAVVWDRTHSPTWLTVTTAVRVVPMVLLGPIGGLLAQRSNRRVVMVASDVVRMVVMLALAGVAVAGLPIWLAPALAGLATAAAVPYPPCVAATTPRLVGDEALGAANAARAVVGPAAVVVGPVVGAALLSFASPAFVILLNAATFALSAVAVLSIRRPDAFTPSGTAERVGVLAELTAGAHALLDHPLARRVVAADAACSAVYGALTVLLLPLSHRVGLGDSGLGLMLGAFGVGGVLATVTATRLASLRRALPVVRVGVAVTALTLPLMGVGSTLVTLAVLAAVCGFGSMVVEVLVETSLQRSLSDEVFAQAYGFAFPAAIAGIVVGALAASALYAGCGLTAALTLVGAGLTVVAAWPSQRVTVVHQDDVVLAA